MRIMHHRLHAIAAALSDMDLLRHVSRLASQAREATVELVAHIAEIETRKLHLREGYGSLFSYCTGPLRLGEHAAYNRIEAARLSRQFPAILDLLGDGSLNLSTVRLLAPHLRPDNFEAVVDRARGRSKREVEKLVAELAPSPDVAPSVRKLPVRAPAAGLTSSAAAPPSASSAALAPTLLEDPQPRPEGTPAPPVLSVPTAASELPTQRPIVAPLSPERYRVQFTVGAATHEKLRRVQDVLRREIPDGDPGAIFDRALTLLLEDVARKKMAITRRPRAGVRLKPGSRNVPAAVQRAVWIRDEGRCAYIAPNGRRCTERVFLEFHHCDPYAIGGEATVENISLRCHAHNEYEAELLFGPWTGRSKDPELAPGRDVLTSVAPGTEESADVHSEEPVP
jgi:hypothetical protein